MREKTARWLADKLAMVSFLFLCFFLPSPRFRCCSSPDETNLICCSDAYNVMLLLSIILWNCQLRRELAASSWAWRALGLYGGYMAHKTSSGFFIFLFFIFVFYKNIFSFSEIYRNIPGRPAAGRPRAFLQKFSLRICAEVPGGPVARQRSGRPPR